MRPHKKGGNGIINDKSLSEKVVDVLFEMVIIKSEINLFRRIVQRRNRLMILMLYYLGVRGGELLNIRISHINFNSNQLSLVRRADEKSDPNIIQPLVVFVE